ncbi:hypothetical protein ACHAXT_002238 [Thalassiosira profunda]
MIGLPSVRSVWKVLFATAALLEVQYIALLMRTVDDDAKDSDLGEYCRTSLVYYTEEEEFSINYTFIDRAWESTLSLSQVVFVWVGPFFCVLCLLEALVRAVEARKMARDNRALDDLEKSLLEAAQKSTIRLSMFFTGAAADKSNSQVKFTKRISKALRSWIPAIATIAFWLFILPTDISDFHHRCGSESLHDSAVITQWMNRMAISLAKMASAIHGLLETLFWTKILPYRIHKEPQRFLQRLQVILRWLRWIRFAGPLFRMGLKLQDQIRAVWRARWQSKKSDMEKQRRRDRPSMIFSDIQRLFQQAKEQTALAKVPSFTIQSSPISKVSSQVVEAYTKRRDFGKQLNEQLTSLQQDYFHFRGVGDSFTATSDLYDRIVKVSQDIAASVNSDRKKYSQRYMKSLHSFLSSREYLISPRTRFSLAWRVTVTNCLLLEIARLCASWHLSGSFSITLSQIVGRLLVNCKNPKEMKHHLAFITDHINQFQRGLHDMFPLFGPPPVDVAVCVPSGPQALLILHFGRMLERFVDVVVFFDIFIWFLTGDIDIDTHAIVPKPFFTRCILPGTLVQVLDHPTLPDLLPSLLRSTLEIFATVGYSRCLRWILALAPAFKMLVLDPATEYFFEHIEEDAGLMHVAKSAGLLTPERKAMQGDATSFRFGGSRRDLFRRLGSDAYNFTSQVGLSYDSDSEYNLRGSLVTTEVSSSEDTEHLPPALQQPNLSERPLAQSPRRKTVHFGLFDSDRTQSAGKVDNDDTNPNSAQSTSRNETEEKLGSCLDTSERSHSNEEESNADFHLGYNLSSHELQADAPPSTDKLDTQEETDEGIGYALSANELTAATTLSDDNTCR